MGSEKRDSAAFRKRILPTRAELTRAIASGGALRVEGERATLNVIKMDPATASKSTGSSTTVAIPLALENGAWKIVQSRWCARLRHLTGATGSC